MGYIVRVRGNRFQVRLQNWDKETQKMLSRAVPRADWGAHGFRADMTPEEAKAHASRQNADSSELRHRERRESIRRRVETEERRLAIDVPLAEEFIRTELKVKSHRAYFATCMRMIRDTGLTPVDYDARKEVIWQWFLDQAFSPAYVQKLTQTLNRYGKYWAWRHRQLFPLLTFPRGQWRERLADRAADVPGRGNKESAPLTPSLLEGARASLRPEHYNWLYLSLWFGLRPSEVDALKSPKLFRLEKQNGTTVLVVYQRKLTAIKREQRWKFIPAFRREQAHGLDILASGDFEKPLSKTINRIFGHEYSLYAGRKGFTDLMLSFGQSLEDVSSWMGHASIERTWRHYKNKRVVRWKA